MSNFFNNYQSNHMDVSRWLAANNIQNADAVTEYQTTHMDVSRWLAANNIQNAADIPTVKGFCRDITESIMVPLGMAAVVITFVHVLDYVPGIEYINNIKF